MFVTDLWLDNDMTTTTTYRLTDTPRRAQFTCFDCAWCQFPEITRPVFLIGPDGGVAAYGSGCAAKLLGLPVAEVEATAAAADLVELITGDLRISNVWRDFVACLPDRVTPKFIRETAAHARQPIEVVETVAALYRTIKRGGNVRAVVVPS